MEGQEGAEDWDGTHERDLAEALVDRGRTGRVRRGVDGCLTGAVEAQGVETETHADIEQQEEEEVEAVLVIVGHSTILCAVVSGHAVHGPSYRSPTHTRLRGTQQSRAIRQSSALAGYRLRANTASRRTICARRGDRLTYGQAGSCVSCNGSSVAEVLFRTGVECGCMGRKRRISEGAQAKPVIEGGVGTVVRRVNPRSRGEKSTEDRSSLALDVYQSHNALGVGIGE